MDSHQTSAGLEDGSIIMKKLLVSSGTIPEVNEFFEKKERKKRYNLKQVTRRGPSS